MATTIEIYRPGSPATLIASVNIDENTRLIKRLMTEHKISSEFYSSSVLAIQIGDYITYGSENFYINRTPAIEKISNTDFRYRIEFESVLYDLAKKLFISSDGLADFSYTGEPVDFVANIVANLNVTGSGWSVGTVDSADSTRIDFPNESCMGALIKVAEKFSMEFSLSGKAISLRTAVGVVTGYSFQYGRGLGLYKISREQIRNQNIITKCYGFGGTRNIPSTYRSRAKRLIFESAGNRYLTKNTATYGTIEGQYTDDNIYPQRTSTLTDVNMVFDAGVSGTDFNNRTSYIEDSAIDFDLNDYLLEGLTAKVVFKSGDLSGIECEIWKYDAANKRIYFNAYSDADGYTYPFYNGGSPVIPAIGDSYTLVDMKMPDSYVTAAETALQAATQAFLDKYSVPQVVYSVDFDPKYAREHAISLDAGDKVTVVDTDLGINSLIRVSGIEFPLTNAYEIKAIIADFVPYNVQERIIQAASNTKKDLHTVNKEAEELARLNALRLHQQKARNTVPMYQGTYSSGTTYYGNPSRIDIVKYNPGSGEVFYIARVDAPSESFSGIAPTNTDYWTPFEAQYASIATQLLFAELAYIDNLGVKYFNGVPVPVGNLAGSVTNVQANIALSAAWEPDFNYNTGDKCSNDGTNYIATGPSVNQEPPTGPWSTDPDQPQKRIDKVTLTGTSGTANVTCDGLTKLAIWNDSGLTATAADFVTLYAAAYLAGGVVLTSSGADLFFEASVAGTDFTGSTSIVNAVNFYRGSIKIQGNEMWENAENNDTNGFLSINRRGYNGGFTRKRHTQIGDGMNSPIVDFLGTAEGNEIVNWVRKFFLMNIPTSSAGLLTGEVYRDGAGADAVLKIK